MKTITIEELLQLDQNTITVLDVRPADAYTRGSVPGAVSIPLAEVEERMEELPKEGKYTGSVKAIQKLVIDRVNDSVTEILQSVTLHDLEKEYQEYIDYGQDMYYI